MACYVDDAEHAFGRMKMCHLWADSEAELMAMVDAIGVDRKWVQRPPKASWLHFDISLSKRVLAMSKGAHATDRFGPVAHVARLDIASDDPDRVGRGVRALANIEACRAWRRAQADRRLL